MLRRDALDVALGILFVFLGGPAVAYALVQRRKRNVALFWLGLFACLYGVRLLAGTDAVRVLLALPESMLDRLQAVITYCIALPATLFLREIFPAFRPTLRWFLAVEAVLAVCGIAADMALGRALALGTVNNILTVLILAGGTVFVVAMVRTGRSTPDVRTLVVGLLVFVLTAALANLAGLGMVPEMADVEPLGFAVFLVSLGRVLARRTAANEERLVALDNELEFARRIQTGILPRKLPTLPGVVIAARYQPMAAVAGDFYDFLPVDGQRLGVLVADVSGHGVPAALIASMVKVAAAAQAPHAEDPALVLTGMNRALTGNAKGQFVTAAYLFLDRGQGKMRYASAGHPPLLWWRAAERRVEAVTQNGLALGLRASARYQCLERAVAAGDRLLLYTDGLLEAMNEGQEQYGEERVRAAMEESADSDAETCATALLDGLARWAGHDRGRSPEDDLTLVVVDVR